MAGTATEPLKPSQGGTPGMEQSASGVPRCPSRPKYSLSTRARLGLIIVGFLAPNLVGFLLFTFFPVILSFLMSFTNWSLSPAQKLHFIGLRNFEDLLWFRPRAEPAVGVLYSYVAASLGLVAGMIGLLWANISQWRGGKLGSVFMAATGITLIAGAILTDSTHGLIIAGVMLVLFGCFGFWRDEGFLRIGMGTLPGMTIAFCIIVLWRLRDPMSVAYEPLDFRFWTYFYNTLYLMLAIPFSVAGSLMLAMLLSDELPLGPLRKRLVGVLFCLVLGTLTFGLLWYLGRPNLAVLGALFWVMAALGFAFNVLAFRTIFYLPSFTAGVALMILWKALYNPETGPVNLGIEWIGGLFGYTWEGPQWLASNVWAKPALIIMGLWTVVGGINMLLYLAGLSNIPPDLLDAAEVDGAGRWQKFRHVIWPQLAPTTFFITVMSIIGGLQGGFEQARVMTNGGPGGATTTLSFYIYLKAFQELNLGYAAAISWILFAIIFVATAINWRFGKDLEVD